MSLIKTIKHDKFVILFGLGSLFIMGTFLALIVINNKSFTPKKYFHTIIDNAKGIQGRPRIVFKGYEIGRVSGFSLTKENTIKVDFYVFTEFSEKVVVDSLVSTKINPVNGEISEFELLTPPPVKDKVDNLVSPNDLVPHIDSTQGHEIKERRKISVSELGIFGIIGSANKILNEFHKRKTMTKIDGILNKVNIILKTFIENKTLNKLDHIAHKGSSILNEVDELRIIPKVDARIADVKSLTDSLKFIFKNYQDPQGLLVKLGGHNLNDLFKNANDTMIYMKDVLEIVHFNRREIDPLLQNTNKSLEDLQKTLKILNSLPIIRSYSPKSPQNFGVEIND